MANKSSIKPLFDNVLVRPVAAEEKTAGGIILPDSVKEKPQIGEIMAVGDGAFDESGKVLPMVVRIGQKVLFGKWGGNDVKVNNEEWKLVKQTDILAVISES